MSQQQKSKSQVVIVAEADEKGWFYFPLDRADKQNFTIGSFPKLSDAIESAIEKTPGGTHLKVYRKHQRLAGLPMWPNQPHRVLAAA